MYFNIFTTVDGYYLTLGTMLYLNTKFDFCVDSYPLLIIIGEHIF